MDALHAAVIQRPTIKACTTEILGAIAGFESGVHYHGADGHFLQSLGYAEPMVDLGKVIDRFLLPVRRRMQASNKDCKLSQSVACVVLKGKWRSPHHSVNDAWMLYESFKGLVELLDSVMLSYLRASASRPFVPPSPAHASGQVCVGCSDGCVRIDKPGRPETSVAL